VYVIHLSVNLRLLHLARTTYRQAKNQSAMVLNYYCRVFLLFKFFFFVRPAPTAGADRSIACIVREREREGGLRETAVLLAGPLLLIKISCPYTCNPRSSRAHSWLTGTGLGQGWKEI